MECNHYLRVLQFILKFLIFTDSPILQAKDLHFNSLKSKVLSNRMQKTRRHFKNYIPIPFSVLWDRRAGIRCVRLMQKVTTAIPHCAQPRVSRFASCPAWLHFKISISPSDSWDGPSLESCCEHCTICTLQKVPIHRGTKQLLMPALLRHMFSPFLLHKSHCKV